MVLLMLVAVGLYVFKLGGIECLQVVDGSFEEGQS
jgi:hypothetical protein